MKISDSDKKEIWFLLGIDMLLANTIGDSAVIGEIIEELDEETVDGINRFFSEQIEKDRKKEKI